MEQDSDEEAGSIEASQLEYDSGKPNKKINMDNVLNSLASKSQVEEEVKKSQFKQSEETSKVPGLNQASTQAFNPRKLTNEQIEAQSKPADNKRGFKDLFKNDSKVSRRICFCF